MAKIDVVHCPTRAVDCEVVWHKAFRHGKCDTNDAFLHFVSTPIGTWYQQVGKISIYT